LQGGRGERGESEQGSRGWEEEGYGDQGSYGQPSSSQYRTQRWNQDDYGQEGRYGREGEYGRQGSRTQFGGSQYGGGQQGGQNRGGQYGGGQQGQYRGGPYGGAPMGGQFRGGQGGTQYSGGQYSGSQFSGGQPGRHVGKGPKGYRRSDERIQEDINDQLTHHGDIDATEITVKVTSGVVTLSGTVEDRNAKRMAEDLAESVSGVQEVQNQLKVGPSGSGNGSKHNEGQTVSSTSSSQKR
jgi:osmotically-inducible protein OsmY